MKQELGPLQLAWVEALESGKYRQTNSYLATSEGFCCLGVACELLMEKTFFNKVKEDLSVYTFADETAYLPREILERMKFRDNKGKFIHNEQLQEAMYSHNLKINEDSACLSVLNDIVELSFKEIAELVRLSPSSFFTEPA